MDNYQIFISYRRDGGDAMAGRLADRFTALGYKVFYDVDSMRAGTFNEQILDAIGQCNDFLIVLPPNALDRCVNADDWVRKELSFALEHKKNIIPIMMRGFEFPATLPEDIDNVRNMEGVLATSEYFDAVVQRIESLLLSRKKENKENKVSVKINNTVVPEKSNDASSESTKKKKSLPKKFGIISVILIAIMVVACIIAFGGKDKNPAQSGETYKAEVVMSDNLLDFTLNIEGTVIKLPCRYEDLTAAGWTISSANYSDTTTIVGSAKESYDMSNNGKKISVTSYNLSGNTKTIKDCLIGEISWAAYNGVDVKMAKGITVNSTVDEIRTAFGNPNEYNDHGDYESLKYKANESVYNEVRFTRYKDADQARYSAVYVKNYLESEDDITETNAEKPKYLKEYKTPAQLGNDFKSGIVEIEGDLYQLPAPVSAFTDNGWQIIQHPGAVRAGNRESICVQRDNLKLYLYVMNFANYQTLPENCAVCSVSVSDTDGISIALPNGISMSSIKAYVESVVTDEFYNYEGDTYSSWSYSEYKERSFNLDIYVDAATNKVERIRVACSTWPDENAG